MNPINFFINSRVENLSSSILVDTLPDLPVKFGDWCLTPIRYLLDGNKVTFSKFGEANHIVDHTKEFANSKRSFLKLAASIIFLVPGLIIGSAFKALGYLSPSIRQSQRLAFEHYKPIQTLTLGSPDIELDLERIKNSLSRLSASNALNRPTKNLIIYAQENVQINEDPGLLALNPEKIILVGARLVHEPSAASCLDDELCRRGGWETSMMFKGVKNIRADRYTNVIQWITSSVETALADVPPKISAFSSERYKRIYLID